SRGQPGWAQSWVCSRGGSRVGTVVGEGRIYSQAGLRLGSGCPATPCAQGHFCDEHFGLCLPTRPEGHYCRHDPHCAPGLVCMFGKCQQPAPPGQDGECGAGTGGTRSASLGRCDAGAGGAAGPLMSLSAPPGARCQRDEECGPGGCCARQHGERVCQRRLALAQSCHVPPGGLAFSINQVCPCQAGLVCRPSVPSREAELCPVQPR
uniref:Uncharacterized protein n=1 Tax=Geospiza parvula TaxID=87175 RepID=A0A8C3MR28_GEOPR